MVHNLWVRISQMIQSLVTSLESEDDFCNLETKSRAQEDYKSKLIGEGEERQAKGTLVGLISPKCK